MKAQADLLAWKAYPLRSIIEERLNSNTFTLDFCFAKDASKDIAKNNKFQGKYSLTVSKM